MPGNLSSTLVLVDNGTIHNPVWVHLLPNSTILPWYFTMQFIFVKVTSHPALHRVMTDSSKCAARPGMMWPLLAWSGSWGSARVHVCMDATCASFGSLTFSKVNAVSTSDLGAARTRKWLVAPESNIAHSLMFFIFISTVDRSTLAAYATLPLGLKILLAGLQALFCVHIGFLPDDA